MVPESQLSLYKSITHRYLIAVLIIAVLSVAAFITLQLALNDSDSTAQIVNLSGRQRMLSQHIALDVHRLFRAKYVNHQSGEEYQTQLKKNIIDMRKANHQLSTGVLGDDQIVNLSPTISAMYFGKMHLNDRVNQYLDRATEVVNGADPVMVQRSIEWVDEQSEQLLIDLNAVVNQYQIEGEDRLYFIEQQEVVVLITTLTILVLEILFIFRPMAREVLASKASEAKTLANLQDLVEIRTIKLEKSNKKLQELASHDPLTGLKNRLTMEADIEQMISNFNSHGGAFAVAMIDIDHFKSINDNHGHLAGDHVLKQVSKLLADSFRESDRVYRAGGEEFFIILQRLTETEASDKLERLRQIISQHEFEFDDQKIGLTISLGLYQTDMFAVMTPNDIMRRVDEALYYSKNSGRNRLTLARRKAAKQPVSG